VGLLSVGHHTYWAQFEGLREELLAKAGVLAEKLRGHGVETVDFGLVDRAEAACAALPRVQAADLDLRKYHGKPGSGASVEFRIREGPITMLGIGVTAAGRFKFVIAEGESLRGPIPPTGNTNTHGRFAPDVRTFLARWVAEGPTHHFALGVGHHAETLRRLAHTLNIEAAVTTPPAG
jgi:L-arabinose isomerase